MQTFLGDFSFSGSAGVLLPVIAVTLSLCIPIVAIIVDHFQKKAKMRLLEKAIEHGVDPAEIKLDVECQPGQRLPYRSGMVTMAVGIALLVGSRFEVYVGFAVQALLVVGGAICFLVGLALLINDYMNRDKLRQQAPSGEQVRLRERDGGR